MMAGPVAESAASPWKPPPAGPGAVLRVSFPDSGPPTFFIRGDQIDNQGDILKWDPLLNFLGFHTRYRLTRLRGRYLKTAEKQGPSTIRPSWWLRSLPSGAASTSSAPECPW